MVLSGSLQFPPLSEIRRNGEPLKYLKYVVGRGNQHLRVPALSSCASRQDFWSRRISAKENSPMCSLPYRFNVLRCHSFLFWGQNVTIPAMKTTTMVLTRSCDALQGSFFVTKFGSAIGIIIFALWGLRPLVRISRDVLLHKTDSSWKKSSTYYVMTSYLQPILLWTGAMLICRGFDPIAMPTETSQLVKQKLLTFGKSLSTVLAFAYCLSSAIQQAQNYLTETNDPAETKNMGLQFAGKAIYTAVWVAAASLFMELLGFSTQKWLTAGGLGTVLLTLAGREIFTNFLSSAMIHATRPFVVNDWIQTKIEGYEVSGHVEHVGWWSPTIIRGEDREAIHIPNHKFTMNVVRNLTQKSHWRIKTHLAISHLDVSKMNIIVADMRKVLAKNPHVEQQRLHRRVFLENINPENQALTILISCFVKTSHFEEYLCVKEVILLDLLRVIRHHRARLATPIRTIQNVYNDVDLDSIPFSDTIFTRNRPASRRPLLLIERSQKINGEDKSKLQSRSVRKSGGERENGSTEQLTPDPKADSKTRGTPTPPEPNNAIDTTREVEDDNKLAEASTSESRDENMAVGVGSSKSSRKVDGKATALKRPSSELESDGENVLKKNSENMPPKKGNVETHGMDGKSTNGPRSGAESPKSGSADVMEENMVLGVALEGSKRTLPIEELNSGEDQAKEQGAGRNNGHAISASEKDDKEE